MNEIRDRETEEAREESRGDSAALLAEFEDDGEIEDSDRDSDFAAIYPEEAASDDQEGAWVLVEESSQAAAAWEEARGNRVTDDAQAPVDHDERDAAPLPPHTGGAPDYPGNWAELEEETEETEYQEAEAREWSISPAMIGVAVVAMVLLGFGGYGVVKERAALAGEIRELRASLAKAAPPQDEADTRSALTAVNEQKAQLEQQVARLSLENQNLLAIVAGLEAQLSAQIYTLEQAPSAAAPAQAAPKPAAPKQAAPKPATSRPAARQASAPAGDWFVNFSSYTQRDTAESWVGKLRPARGQVVVSETQSAGRAIYRVRVVGLPDRASAEAIARSLERQYRLGKLWVGKSE